MVVEIGGWLVGISVCGKSFGVAGQTCNPPVRGIARRSVESVNAGVFD